jgi:hypothetical protein
MGPESRIELQLVRAVKADGGVSYKFTSPARRNVPDRLNLYRVRRMAETLMDVVNERVEFNNPMDFRSAYFEAQRLLALAIRFAEVKAPGKKLRPGQKREKERLEALGFQVDVVDGQLPLPLEE